MRVLPLIDKQKLVHALLEMKAVFLDFDGTLVNFHEAEKKAFYHFLNEHNVPKHVHEKALQQYKQINEKLWSAFTRNELSIEEVLVTRFTHLKEVTNINGNEIQLDKEFRDLLVHYTTLSEENRQALKQLKRKGIKVLIVTNGVHETQVKRIKKLGLEKLIDGLVSSQQVGIAKPNPKIFEAALNISEEKVEYTWMIGDSLDSDIKGAKELGLFTCYVTSEMNEKHEWQNKKNMVNPDVVVTRFDDFVKYFLSIKQ